MDARLFTLFPGLAALEPAARAYLAAQLRPARLAAGDALFHPGGLCQLYPFLLAGRVVVRRVARSGREIVLYRVQPGQTCIMTTTCLVGATEASAEAVAEMAVEALALPPAGFAHLVAESPVFRGFAFGACAQRIGDLMARIEELSDLGIDQRLAARLLAAMAPDGTVCETHAALADDIGTAREVVSRALKQFAARGWVAMRRGEVRLVARAALARVAAGEENTGSECDEVTDSRAGSACNAASARRLTP